MAVDGSPESRMASVWAAKNVVRKDGDNLHLLYVLPAMSNFSALAELGQLEGDDDVTAREEENEAKAVLKFAADELSSCCQVGSSPAKDAATIAVAAWR